MGNGKREGGTERQNKERKKEKGKDEKEEK